MVEVTVWPELFERTQDYWMEGNIVVLDVRVRERRGRLQVAAQQVELYQPDESGDFQPPAWLTKEPAISSQQSAVSDQQPGTSSQQSATSNQQPVTSNQQLATSNQQPATSDQRPAHAAPPRSTRNRGRGRRPRAAPAPAGRARRLPRRRRGALDGAHTGRRVGADSAALVARLPGAPRPPGRAAAGHRAGGGGGRGRLERPKSSLTRGTARC